MTPLNTIIEEEKMSTADEVVAEFQLVHDTENIWKDETGETAFVPIGNLEDWIRQLVVNRDAHWQHAMQRAYEAAEVERERCVKMLEPIADEYGVPQVITNLVAGAINSDKIKDASDGSLSLSNA